MNSINAGSIILHLLEFFTAAGVMLTAYFTMRTKQISLETKDIAAATQEITTDTNVRAVNTEKTLEDVRHQTNALTQQLVDETAERNRLQGEQTGRQQERGTIDEREAERSNLQAERQAERAEDRAERQEMRESWQAHERAEGRRGLPDGEAHE